MKFQHTIVVNAPQAKVQALLDDIERAAFCVPGLQAISPLEDGWYEGKVGIKFGPLGMTFTGKARLDQNEDGKWRMHGEGRDRRVGAAVVANVEALLSDAGVSATQVVIDADVTFSGRLAEMGQPLIRKKSDAMVAEFAKNLEKEVTKS
jgi:carbon monoxide dehydrogenase subunit G